MSSPDTTPTTNPFPGPRPYRTVDRERFFGREEMAQKLADRIFVHPVLTLYGPSGAGKSSLMAAGVIPRLDEEHGMRVVRVDAWPAGEVPLPWLVKALFSDLKLGPVPKGKSDAEALDESMRLAKRQSGRPMLIYLDQLEQILLPGRDPAQAVDLLDGLDVLANQGVRGLHLVMALREDYLGRLRDRARGRRALLEEGFRLGPMTVGEMVKAVVAAAEKGVPAQQWDEAETLGLLLAVRESGESESTDAEVQAAFGQIVCRDLWEERAAASGDAAAKKPPQEAGEILRRYLDETVAKLGPWEAEARRLLEEHLIDKEGNRTPLTEREARLALSKEAADEVLSRLEKEAVLRAEEHQGSRYFELGHDWLAKRVFEHRKEREQAEEERRQKEEQGRKERAREEEERKRREEEKAARRWLGIIAGVSIAFAIAMTVVVVWALGERDKAREAERAAQAAEEKAAQKAKEADDNAIRAETNAAEAADRKKEADLAKEEYRKQAEQHAKDLREFEAALLKAKSDAEFKTLQAAIAAKRAIEVPPPPQPKPPSTTNPNIPPPD